VKPLVLIPSGDADADFTYASGFPVETGLYIRFADGDDVLVASPLEIDRAKSQSKAARKLGYSEAGYVDHGEFASWPRLAARMLREKGLEEARVSPRLQAVYLEELRSTGVEVEIDRELFRAERRHKTAEEAAFIQAAQRAAGSGGGRGRAPAGQRRDQGRDAVARRPAANLGTSLRSRPAAARGDGIQLS